MATVAERVVHFLKQKRSKSWCDKCIADQLELKRELQAYHVANVLGLTIEYARERGECELCKEYKTVTRHA